MIGKPDFDAEASEVYGEVLDALHRADIRYMLGGALALNTYTGIWRDTKDLDVFVEEEMVPRVLAVLEEVGLETEVADPVWLAKARRGELFADVIHASHNGTGTVDESWFENVTEISILDRRGLLIPPEGVILS